MIKITLPDGSVKEFAVKQLLWRLQKAFGFARNVISALIVQQLKQQLFDYRWQSYITWNADGRKLSFYFTSWRRFLKKCILESNNRTIYFNGFYYDVDFEDQKITDADFKKIEDRVLDFREENMNSNYALFLKLKH
jgi:threonyl-tRNA synthetase